MTKQAMLDISPLALNLAFHQTALLPSLQKLLDAVVPVAKLPVTSKLNQLAFRNATLQRSDGMSWCLYYLKKYSLDIDPKVAQAVLESRDCIAIAILFATGVPEYKKDVRAFAQSLDPSDLYLLDQYWLLLFELFAAGEVTNPYPKDDTFVVMHEAGVRFML
jgi:hypothetical protein